MASKLSKRQTQLLAAVCEVMKTDIDWRAVAERANFKTSKYARDSWTIVRKKLIGDVLVEGGSIVAERAAKRNGARTKRSADIGDYVDSLPYKRATNSKTKSTAVPESISDEEDEEAHNFKHEQNEPEL